MLVHLSVVNLFCMREVPALVHLFLVNLSCMLRIYVLLICVN